LVGVVELILIFLYNKYWGDDAIPRVMMTTCFLRKNNFILLFRCLLPFRFIVKKIQ